MGSHAPPLAHLASLGVQDYTASAFRGCSQKLWALLRDGTPCTTATQRIGLTWANQCPWAHNPCGIIWCHQNINGAAFPQSASGGRPNARTCPNTHMHTLQTWGRAYFCPPWQTQIGFCAKHMWNYTISTVHSRVYCTFKCSTYFNNILVILDSITIS